MNGFDKFFDLGSSATSQGDWRAVGGPARETRSPWSREESRGSERFLQVRSFSFPPATPSPQRMSRPELESGFSVWNGSHSPAQRGESPLHYVPLQAREMTHRRSSVSSESEANYSDVSVATPQSVGQETEINRRALSAMYACYKNLLDLQTERSHEEHILGVEPLVFPAIAPTAFSKFELVNIVRFAEGQHELMKKLIAELEKRYTVAAYVPDMLHSLCMASKPDFKQYGTRASTTTGDNSSPLTFSAVSCIQSLKKKMTDWEEFLIEFSKNTEEAIFEAEEHFLHNTETVAIILNHMAKLVMDVKSSLWGVRSSLASKRTEHKGERQAEYTKISKLPFREDQPVELPKVRFPPSRKQKLSLRFKNQ